MKTISMKELEERVSEKIRSGEPPFPKLRYCHRCCTPETSEDTTFDDFGICVACRSSEEKMHISWAEREKELGRILNHYKKTSGDNYDCMVPISGGKDSAFQLHVLVRKYGMKPLAVTFNHNLLSETGKYNLWNILEKLNVDHMMFTPNRSLVNRLMRESMYKIGDACWHCHSGVGAYPLQVAVGFGIRLLVYGESASEGNGATTTYSEPVKYDKHYFTKVSAKSYPEELVNDHISFKELKPFVLPSDEEMERVSVSGIHLGDYMFWDEEKQVELVKDLYDWREDDVEGTYKRYKSVECILPGVHDYMKFVKRGFGRATDFASSDVRQGLLFREEGFALAREIDSIEPRALQYYLEKTGLSKEEFYKTLKSMRKFNFES